MSSITTEMAEILGTVRRPGDFFVTGTAEFRAPVLEVTGVGRLALPLLPAQAVQLAAAAEPTPYGRAEETILDPTVRRSWQIGPERVRLGGRGWTATLEEILGRVADGLGVSAPISASLHKLLLYEAGGFFVGHRDTEKLPGMFATLVIVLPSLYAGGELVVRHKGREVQLDLHRDDPAEAGFAAFYADCVHEVLPITEGSRLTLVYNLVGTGRGEPPQPPGYEREQARLVALLQAWRNGTDDEVPKKLIHVLEHAYTPAELGFPALKGIDAAVAGVLAAAADETPCEIHLALLTIEESGAAEYADSHRGRWDDEDAFEAGEVFERCVVLSEWRCRNGGVFLFGDIPAEDKEFTPPDALAALAPDEEHFHEATGNEGASFERTYRRASLVLWPGDRRFAVLSQGGLWATLPYLDDLVRRWADSTAAQQPLLAAAAHDLASTMIAHWPSCDGYPRDDKAASGAARMLDLLTRVEDRAAIERFLLEVVAGGQHAREDNAAIVGALQGLAPKRRVGLVDRIVTATAAVAPAACADLLARLAAAWPGQRAGLRDAATRLVAALPGDPALAAPTPTWQTRPKVEPDFVTALFTGLDAIDAALSARAADHVLAWPATYDLDRVIVPALRRLAKDDAALATPAGARLRAAALAHLRVRIAEPLAPPADWRRASQLPCRCTRCQELVRYLDDPALKTWIFKAAEADRRHVEEIIRRAGSDVETSTDRRGRPYSLLCTKNQASYERRARQRTQDVKDVAVLAD